MVLQTRPISVEEICNKLRPVFGDKIDKIYFQYTLADGREEREEIAHVLNSLYQKNLSQLLDKGVLLEPPRKEDMSGNYALGRVSYADKELFDFTLREKDWQRHMCITGMSGSGKTNFAFKIIQELSRHNKNFLIFDWKKSFRPLLADNAKLMNITVGDKSVSNVFKVNLNCPPEGVSPKEWVVVLADLLTESFMASFGVHKIILETLDNAFKEWGVYNGSTNYPTWNHIKHKLEEKLEKISGREAGWLESALRIATVLTFGEFGKTLNYKGENSITIDDILNGQVIMELNSLGTVEKKFFCEFLLMYIYKLKKARQNDVEQKFDHVIIVDEAHNIFLKKPTNFSNESVTDMIYREMREYGTSLICLDQHISKISDTVKGNSACHIAFQQQLPQDIDDIANLMQLRENKHFFSGLTVGTAIVKLSERYTSPFLMKVALANKRKKNITNEDVRGRMQGMMLNAEFANETDKEFNDSLTGNEISEPEINTCFYRKNGQRFSGVHDKLKGDASRIVGDASNISGDVSNVIGNVSNLIGSISKISGDVTFITGDLVGLFGDVTALRGDVTNLTGDVQELMKEYESMQNSDDVLEKKNSGIAPTIQEEIIQN
ncbi:ATP-binding protein, partial [archaeon]|nr:ATP-binding protein [archaeon]